MLLSQKRFPRSYLWSEDIISYALDYSKCPQNPFVARKHFQGIDHPVTVPVSVKLFRPAHLKRRHFEKQAQEPCRNTKVKSSLFRLRRLLQTRLKYVKELVFQLSLLITDFFFYTQPFARE